MMIARLHKNEEERIKALRSYDIIDSEDELEYDSLAQLVAQMCGTPIGMINFVDVDEQWTKAKVGLDIERISRDYAFCAHTINEDGIFEVVDARGDERFFDNPLVKGDPKIRFYAGAPIIDKDGNPLGAVCVIDKEPRTLDEAQKFALKTMSTQVSTLLELRKKNKKLQETLTIALEQQRELERQNAIKNKLMSIVSHDIRGPLATLSSLLDLADQDMLSEGEFKSFFGSAKQMIKNTDGLIDELLDWLILQREGIKVNKVEVKLNELIQKLVNQMNYDFKRKSNELINQIPNDFTILADEGMLSICIRNLLTNSNKFTDGGKIILTAGSVNGEKQFCIEDTGKGMPADKAVKLFDGSRKSSDKGTLGEKGRGIGLIFVNEVLQVHNAKVDVTSEIGKGTKICLKFPNL